MKKTVNIYATQGGGYCFWDEKAKRFRFTQEPPGVGHGFKVMDLVPADWGVEGPVGKATLRCEEYSVERMDFFQGQDVCPYCQHPLDNCDCSDFDVASDMGDRG